MLGRLKRRMTALARAVAIGPDAAEFWIHRNKYKNTRNRFIKAYHKLCCAKILYKNNAAIPMGVRIQEKFKCPHGLNGILISEGAVIGRNCTVFQQVTIGSNTLNSTKKAGAPVIGDNVYIGAGAKIIGGIRIGDNVRIGANCVIVEDIPDNSTVVMNKPRIILHKEPIDNTFVAYENFASALDENKGRSSNAV